MLLECAADKRSRKTRYGIQTSTRTKSIFTAKLSREIFRFYNVKLDPAKFQRECLSIELTLLAEMTTVITHETKLVLIYATGVFTRPPPDCYLPLCKVSINYFNKYCLRTRFQMAFQKLFVNNNL